MQLQRSKGESLPPQQLCEWYASRSGGGGSSGRSCAAVQLGVSGGGLAQLQRRPRETLTPQHLREWYARRGASRSSARCPYVICTGARAGQTCRTVGHTQSGCFSYRSDTWRAEFGATAEIRRWLELLRQGVDIFALDYDAILNAMYALPIGTEGDCSLCVLPDPGIEVAALGASESGLPGTAPAEALHTFTLHSGRHLATFTRWQGSSLYTLATKRPQIAASTQVSVSGPVAPPCSCRLLSHQTLLWHHRLGHPSLPRLRGMHSCLLVSGLPRSLPPLLPSPAPPCLHCVEGRQRAAPHSSFPPTTTPLQTLHMDVKGEVPDVLIPWIRAVRLQLRERFRQDLPVLRLHSDKGDSPQQNGIAERYIGLVMEVTRTSMIHAAAPHFLWPFAVRYTAHQLNLWPRVSLPETSPTLRWTGKVGNALVSWVWGSRAFVRDMSADKLSARAIPCVFLGFSLDVPGWQFYHPSSRRIFPSQDVTFDESVPFYRLFLLEAVANPLPSSVPVEVALDSGDARGAASGCAEPGGAEHGGAELASVDSGGAEPEGVEPGGAESGGAEPRGTASSGGPAGASQLLSPWPEPLSPQQLCEWFTQRTRLRSGAAGAGDSAPGDTGDGAAGAGDLAEPGGTGAGGTRAGGAGDGDTGAGDTGAGGTGTGGVGAASAWSRLSPRPEPLSPQQLREWFAQRTRLRSGAARAGDSAAGDTGAGGVRVTHLGGAGVIVGAGGTGGAAAAGPRGACTKGTGAAVTGSVGGARAGDPTEPGAAKTGGAGAGGTGAGGAGAGGPIAVDPRAGGVGAGGAGSGGSGAQGTVLPRPYFVPLLQQSQPPLQPASPLPAPSPYTEQTGSLTEHREPASRPALPVRTGRRVPRLRPPPVLGTHAMALRPSSVSLRVLLPSPPESSFPAVPDLESDRARAASPTLVDFAAACRLDYATTLVAESECASPPSVGGECALGTDVLEDRQEDFECLAAAVPNFAFMLLAPEGDPDVPDIPTPRSYAEAITGPCSSLWQVAMDAEMASWKSTGTYVDAVPLSRANIVDGMWIFRVKRPPGSPPAFKARYVAQGFNKRQGVDYFQTFSPTPKMTTLRALLHVVAQRDYELHSLDFSTAFLQGSLHEEFWLCRPPGFTGSFPAGTLWSLRRPVYTLRQAPCKWHNTLRTTLAALGFTPSTADPSLFLRTDTSLPPFYVLVYVNDLVFATADTEALNLVKSELQKRHTCNDMGELRSYLGLQITRDRARRTITLTQSHMVHQFVEPSGPYPELVGFLMYLMTCTRHDLAYPLSLLARYMAPGRHRKVHWDAAKRVLRYLCSTLGMGLVLGGRGPVVLTGHADASWVDDPATQRSSQGYTFSLCSGSVSWRSTHSSSALSSSCEAEIYAGAMAAQELRWLTYLLTDLREWPRSSPILYVDNKAMIALCHEHIFEHRTKHIALRYFLARELQQRGQLRLVYVATRAKTADIFTEALPSGDHQRFSTVLGLASILPVMQVVPLVASGDVASFKDPHLDAPDGLLLCLACLAVTCTAMPTASLPTMGHVLGDLLGMKEEVLGGAEAHRAACRIDREIGSSAAHMVDFDAQLAHVEQMGSQGVSSSDA
ncbi:unnamed protein product [Closterium sp. NIES-53]